MRLEKAGYGKNAPEEVNVLIEIPKDSGTVKYEYDKDLEGIVVDRMLSMTMQLSYPCNYGFIPQTLGGDGDPIDVLVHCGEAKLIPNCLITVRPIGVLTMEDEAGEDAKILALPTKKQCTDFAHIDDYTQLPRDLLQSIEYFFEHYKDMNPEKWVKIGEWQKKEKAFEIIKEGIKNNSGN